MNNKSFHKDEVVKHSTLGFAHVVNPEETIYGAILVKFINSNDEEFINVNDLTDWPSDQNGKPIEPNDIILFSYSAYGRSIKQGIVKTVKLGKDRGSRNNLTWKIGILPDKEDRVYVTDDPRSCIVVKERVIYNV